MRSDNPWKIIRSKTVYQNPWILVREDEVMRPNGEPGIYGVVESSDSVMICAMNNRRELYLIRSFSYPAQAWRWELPGGGNDGDDATTAAQRELREETGITAETWTQLGDIRVCDGLMTERTKIMLAEGLTLSDVPEADDNDLISDRRFASLDEIYQMVQSGEIDEGQSLTALYLVERYLRQN
jgi:8-oxo-dGTP pyrophosphatase MutT (NUDIX family)